MYTLSRGPLLSPRAKSRAARRRRVGMAWNRRIHVGTPYTLKKVVPTVDGGFALAEYEWDGGLGKFKFKKALKKVARVATAPARIVTASALQAVGVKHGVNKALGIRGKEVGLVKAGRIGAQIIGGAMIAPAAFGVAAKGAAFAGKGLLTAGKFLGTKGAAGAKLFGGLLKKKGAAGEIVETTAEEARNAGILPAGSPSDSGGGLIPDGATVPNEAGASGAAFAPSGGGGAAPLPEEGEGMTKAGISGFPGKVPPLLLGAAALALFFGLKKHARR